MTQKIKLYVCPCCLWTGPAFELFHDGDHTDEYLCPECMYMFDSNEWCSRDESPNRP